MQNHLHASTTVQSGDVQGQRSEVAAQHPATFLTVVLTAGSHAAKVTPLVFSAGSRCQKG